MAALTPLHSSAPFGSPIEMSFEGTGEPQGAEDKQLRNNAQAAVAHWKSRAEFLLVAVQADAMADDYVSIPFEVVKTVQVTYRHVGVLKPAPYPLDG